jgi:hypothetical protein
MLSTLLSAFTGEGGIISTVADKIAADKDEKLRIEAQMKQALLDHAGDLEKARADIIKAEAKSEHTLAAVWRPVLMLVFVAIIANNYILAPYVEILAGQAIMLPIPDNLWQLIQLGVGGYIAGRSGEKIMERFKGDK